jgi:DNA-binding CsgD family transcriptional regulator
LASHDLVGALRASIGAAQQAEAVLAPAETLRHLSSALRLWERVPDPAAVTGTDRVELLLRAAAAANAAGERQRAAGLAEEAATTAAATTDPAQAAAAQERLGLYLLAAGRVEEALRARASAVALVPAQPPTRLRARVTAAMAQALINAERQDEARRWCDEALTVARAIGSAEEEADVLVTQGMIEEHDDPARARPLYAAGRARAAAAGNLEIESRALQDLAWLEFDLGNLAAAQALFDEGVELAQRTGLGWSDIGINMRRGQCFVRYEAGAWDECERLAAAVPGLAPALAVVGLGAAALLVEVGRGRPAAAKRLRDLAALAGLDSVIDLEVTLLEADQATWQGDLERANSAVQRSLAILDTGQFRASPTLENAWICAIGLVVQAERAERARTAGDAGSLSDAIAVGRMLLERAHAAVERAKGTLYAHDVSVTGYLTKAETEWTRLQGRSDPARWQAAVEAFSYGHVYEVARCQWRLAEALLGAGDREQATVAAQAAHKTALQLGAEPLQAALELLARRGRLDLGAGLPAERTLAGLTPRELEVLRLLVEGRSNRQIAEELFISGKTASVHVTNILAKLGVHSRLEAAEVAWLPRGPRSEWPRLGSRALIIRLIIQTIRLDPTGSDQIDEASNVSSPDPSGADQIDAEASGYGSGGWGFESLAARPKPQANPHSCADELIVLTGDEAIHRGGSGSFIGLGCGRPVGGVSTTGGTDGDLLSGTRQGRDNERGLSTGRGRAWARSGCDFAPSCGPGGGRGWAWRCSSAWRAGLPWRPRREPGALRRPTRGSSRRTRATTWSPAGFPRSSIRSEHWPRSRPCRRCWSGPASTWPPTPPSCPRAEGCPSPSWRR